MSRLKRQGRDLGLLQERNFLDAFDNQFKQTWRITDEEYDYLIEAIPEKEFDILFLHEPTFTNAKTALKLIDKYLNEINKI